MCTAAYREALTRDLASTASPAPAPAPIPAPAPSQRQATEAGREGVAGSGPPMTLANDATVIHGEAIDQR
jgi:hypothetical protein